MHPTLTLLRCVNLESNTMAEPTPVDLGTPRCAQAPDKWFPQGNHAAADAARVAEICRTECSWYGAKCQEWTLSAIEQHPHVDELYGVWNGEVLRVDRRAGRPVVRPAPSGCNGN